MSIKKEDIIRLPQTAGCYIFRNVHGGVIYVGKAVNIKKRVSSYFSGGKNDYKINRLLLEAHFIDFVVVENEVGALLLESRLIKQYKPKYNIQLKDDKNYAYIRITKEAFPRLEVVRTLQKKDKAFGPFTSGEARQNIVRLANHLFKLRVCKKLPHHPCILYHIHLCRAPCIQKISQEEYSHNVHKAELLLKGKNEELIESLQREMEQYARERKYELAKVRRDQIRALEYLKVRQSVHLQKQYDQDVINMAHDSKNIYIQIFNIHRGVISGKKDFTFQKEDIFSQEDFLTDFISQYYFNHDIPQEIIIPKEIPGKKLLENYLENISKRKVAVSVPVSGDKMRLLELLKENIIATHSLGERNLIALKEVLGLFEYPKIIECFDVSNLGAKYKVGSMVYFLNGKSHKSQYRRFKIKTVEGQSDVDCMKEIVYRRYSRIKNEKGVFPQLIVVDGGKAQLSIAMEALHELGIDIPIIALAKREEEIYTTDKMYPTILSHKSLALQLLQTIRNEAHRFAVSYHRFLRNKNLLSQKIDD